jgi:hypothetical protein
MPGFVSGDRNGELHTLPTDRRRRGILSSWQ